ncbi:ornithine cyclodeaminase [Natronococcus amylolyticus DSM 10524]|uniref:Ornithine cyclodeaminase n=1 Tax=Natronococcus amylolyticus DSM 10524 TaxID=1227497 RepID=L9X2C3_9EURY|nr:ornithine cyclodeaminase [Natronococcus amylolyticus DSM 10524]
MTDTLFLTSTDVVGLTSPTEYVDVVREGYHQRGEGAPTQPRSSEFRDSVSLSAFAQLNSN